MVRGCRAFSSIEVRRSRSDCVSANRSRRPAFSACNAANFASVSGVSDTVTNDGSSVMSGDVRSGVRRIDNQSSIASGLICQFPELSLKAFKSPEVRARMIELRPHFARIAAFLGDRVFWSMSGPCPGPPLFATDFYYRPHPDVTQTMLV